MTPRPTRADATPDGSALEITVAGDIDADFAAVRAVLLDVEGLGAWFPGVGEWRVLASEPDSMLVYGHQPLPWPITDRDYVVRYRWVTSGLGELQLEASSEVTASMPERDGRVRVDTMRTLWEVSEAGGVVHVRYTYWGSTGARLPRWVMRLGWERRAYAVIDALRDELARRSIEARGSSPTAPRTDVSGASEGEGSVE